MFGPRSLAILENCHPSDVLRVMAQVQSVLEVIGDSKEAWDRDRAWKSRSLDARIAKQIFQRSWVMLVIVSKTPAPEVGLHYGTITAVVYHQKPSARTRSMEPLRADYVHGPSIA